MVWPAQIADRALLLLTLTRICWYQGEQPCKDCKSFGARPWALLGAKSSHGEACHPGDSRDHNISAGESMGLRRHHDNTESDDERIGHAPRSAL